MTNDDITLEDLLKCPVCGTPFVMIKPYIYKYNCDCLGNKNLRIAVG